MPRNKTEKPEIVLGHGSGGTILLGRVADPIPYIGNGCPMKVRSVGFEAGPHEPLFLPDGKGPAWPLADDQYYQIRCRICQNCGSLYYETGLNDG